MRILLLNQTFYPDVASTAQHGFDLARHMAAAGHDVAVIASRSLYGQKWAQLAPRERVDGVDIHRVGASLFGKAGILPRIADFCLFWIAAAAKALTMPRPDAVVALTTPPFIAVLAWLVKALRGAGFVYWVMDLYPDLPIACGVLRRDSLTARLLERVNRFCLRRADRVVVLGRCMRDRVVAKGVREDRVETIAVWPIEEPPESDDAGARNRYREAWGLNSSFVVMYSGNVGLGHDIDTICGAMLELRDRAGIRFVFVGGGKRRSEVEAFVSAYRLPNAAFYPYQPRERLGELLAAGDLHLVSLLEPVWGIMVPSKVYGVMAAGRPAVFIGPRRSEVARLLWESGGGASVPCGDVEGLVAQIERLSADPARAQEMGRNGREALRARYSRECACRRWEQLLLSFGEALPAMRERLERSA